MRSIDKQKAAALEKHFNSLGIPVDAPGFCDHSNFLNAEQRNPRLLDQYANFIEVRSYDSDYISGARRKIDVVADAVRKAILADGRLGACIATCFNWRHKN